MNPLSSISDGLSSFWDSLSDTSILNAVLDKPYGVSVVQDPSAGSAAGNMGDDSSDDSSGSWQPWAIALIAIVALFLVVVLLREVETIL